jgi:hypothetical protein
VARGVERAVRVELLREVVDHGRRRERMVAAEEHVARLREREQARQRRRAAGERRVEVEALEVFEQVGRRASAALEDEGQHQSMARVRHEAARVAQDDLEIRMAPHDARAHEPIRGARRVEQEVRGEGRNAFGGRAGEHRRMHEDDRVAPCELVEEGLVLRIAEVAAQRVREQDHAGGTEHVERVARLRDRALDVGHRKRRVEADAVGMRACRFSEDLVHRACHRAPLGVVALLRIDVHARRRHREDGGRNAVRVHHRERALG